MKYDEALTTAASGGKIAPDAGEKQTGMNKEQLLEAIYNVQVAILEELKKKSP